MFVLSLFGGRGGGLGYTNNLTRSCMGVMSEKLPKGWSVTVNRKGIDNAMTNRKRIQGQTMIYKTLHRKQKIE